MVYGKNLKDITNQYLVNLNNMNDTIDQIYIDHEKRKILRKKKAMILLGYNYTTLRKLRKLIINNLKLLK